MTMIDLDAQSIIGWLCISAMAAILVMVVLLIVNSIREYRKYDGR